MRMRMIVVLVAALACSAQAVAGGAVPAQWGSQDAASKLRPAAQGSRAAAQAHAGSAPGLHRKGTKLSAARRLGGHAPFGQDPPGAAPRTPGLPAELSPQPEERAEADGLNAPFWMFLLWYVGSR